MRISDWSSDVCSSDLRRTPPHERNREHGIRESPRSRASAEAVIELRSEERRVGKECVVRVDLGGRRIIKKKTKKEINVVLAYITKSERTMSIRTMSIKINQIYVSKAEKVTIIC